MVSFPDPHRPRDIERWLLVSLCEKNIAKSADKEAIIASTEVMNSLIYAGVVSEAKCFLSSDKVQIDFFPLYPLAHYRLVLDRSFLYPENACVLEVMQT